MTFRVNTESPEKSRQVLFSSPSTLRLVEKRNKNLHDYLLTFSLLLTLLMKITTNCSKLRTVRDLMTSISYGLSIYVLLPEILWKRTEKSFYDSVQTYSWTFSEARKFIIYLGVCEHKDFRNSTRYKTT